MRGRGPRHRRVPNYVAVEKVGCRHAKLLGSAMEASLCARAGGGVPSGIRRAGARRRAPEGVEGGAGEVVLVVLEWSLGTETNKIMFETGRRSERGHRRHRYAGIVERKGKGMLTERRSAFLLLGV